MNSWEGHGCPDLRWGSYHIVKAWKNGRGGFSSYCPVVEEKVSVKFISIEFCMHQCCSSGFFVLLWRVCGAGRTWHLLFPAALQSNTFRMHFFALKVFVYLLECKKRSLQPLEYLSTKSVFIEQKIWLSCRSLSAFLSPQSRKGTSVRPWMGDSLACCCLQFFPLIWLFWCQEIRNPHTLVYAKQT